MICVICKGTEFQIIQSKIEDYELSIPGQFEYKKCNSCKIIQQDPLPTINQLKSYYPKNYPAFIKSAESRGGIYQFLAQINNWFLKRKLAKFISNPTKVLDIGCGNGEMAKLFIPSSSTEYTGIDFSEEAVQVCFDKGLDVQQGVFLDFNLKPSHFDTIIMNNYIEHVTDPKKEIIKAYKVLTKGGVLFGELPNFKSADRLIFGKYWGGYHIPRHTYQFTPQTISTLLKEGGFKTVKITQEINSGHLAISIQNLLYSTVLKNTSRLKLKSGRAPFFNVLLLMCAPLNLLFCLFGHSGIMRFVAVK